MQNILIVEDDPVFGALMTQTLSQAGFETRLVPCIREALKEIDVRKDSIDGIVLDLCLPNGAGALVVGTLEEAAPEIPIVVVTALEAKEIEDVVIMIGAHDFLPKKSLNMDEVVRSVRHSIVRHKVRGDFKPLQATLAKAEAKVDKADKLVEVMGNSA